MPCRWLCQGTARDLTAKIEANQSRYVDKARFYSGGKYSSCSAKTISQVREWYVDEVLYQVNKQYMAAAGNIRQMMCGKLIRTVPVC
ncbi:MAG: hypothetical protein K8R34_04850 [Methanosarcinales archaeon]|nr:hypothetical protein [Methanosarcinales archaeon]MCD4798761.1 hypothetical protein [Methanosarcinales archaeon]MCD4808595.1 hypothetical protein [Methanosarcinales archaeon]